MARIAIPRIDEDGNTAARIELLGVTPTHGGKGSTSYIVNAPWECKPADGGKAVEYFKGGVAIAKLTEPPDGFAKFEVYNPASANTI